MTFENLLYCYKFCFVIPYISSCNTVEKRILWTREYWLKNIKQIFMNSLICQYINYNWQLAIYTVHSKCINAHTLRSDISLPKCSTHSREMSDKFESEHPLTPSIWSDIVGAFRVFGRTWEWIFKDFFLHFLRWTCQTFCDRCVFTPGKVAQRSIFVTLWHDRRSMHRSTS